MRPSGNPDPSSSAAARRVPTRSLACRGRPHQDRMSANRGSGAAGGRRLKPSISGMKMAERPRWQHRGDLRQRGAPAHRHPHVGEALLLERQLQQGAIGRIVLDDQDRRSKRLELRLVEPGAGARGRLDCGMSAHRANLSSSERPPRTQRQRVASRPDAAEPRARMRLTKSVGCDLPAARKLAPWSVTHSTSIAPPHVVSGRGSRGSPALTSAGSGEHAPRRRETRPATSSMPSRPTRIPRGRSPGGGPQDGVEHRLVHARGRRAHAEEKNLDFGLTTWGITTVPRFAPFFAQNYFEKPATILGIQSKTCDGASALRVDFRMRGRDCARWKEGMK